MKREIKFRIWDNTKENFFTPTYEAYKGNLEELHIGLNGDLFIRNMNSFTHESCFPNRYITEQYTGLKDKNGTEIYEGDILINTDNEKLFASDYYDFIYTVMYSESHSGLNSYTREDLEIIGNIHENKDLI